MKRASGFLISLVAPLALPAYGELKLPEAERAYGANSVVEPAAPGGRAEPARRQEPVSAGEPAQPSTVVSVSDRPVASGPATLARRPPPASPEASASAPRQAKAFDYDLFVDVDGFYKLSGGVRPPADGNGTQAPAPQVTVGMLHYYGEYSTGDAGLWDNGRFVSHVIFPFGTSPKETVGDLRSVSNVDAEMNALQLLEAWYEHRFPHANTAILFGIASFGAEFYKSRYAGLFMHSAFGIGTDVLWNAMVSNPPNTTLGMRIRTDLSKTAYLQAAFFDGFPDHSTKLIDLRLDRKEGVFSGAELGFAGGTPNKRGYYKLAVGGWYLKQDIEKNMMVGFENYSGPPKHGTGGTYGVVEYGFSDRIGVFGKAGRAAEDINKYTRYYATGIILKLFASRPKDSLGLGVTQSRLGGDYLLAHGFDEHGNPVMYGSESIYELTYRAQITRKLSLQPDLQYVLQPNFDAANQSALVVGVRGEYFF